MMGAENGLQPSLPPANVCRMVLFQGARAVGGEGAVFPFRKRSRRREINRGGVPCEREECRACWRVGGFITDDRGFCFEQTELPRTGQGHDTALLRIAESDGDEILWKRPLQLKHGDVAPR